MGKRRRSSGHSVIPPLRFLRRGRWKYIHKVEPELYDIEADPGERTNLAERHPEILKAMRGELAQLIESNRVRAKEAIPVDEETKRQLEALGYAGLEGSTAPPVRDDRESLRLEGPDPNSLLADVSRISEAKGLVEAGALRGRARAYRRSEAPRS